MILLMVALALTTPAAWGQDEDVAVQLDTFGVGGRFRPGEFTAIRVGLTSNLPEATEIWVQWEVPNADGDIAEHGRSLALTPGKETKVWLYAMLPPDAQGTSVWSVRVFNFEDGQRRAELGGIRISPRNANATQVAIRAGMIGVIGQASMRLNTLTAGYANTTARPPGSHEDVAVVLGLQPSEFPDRWEGLKGFETIAWGDAINNPPQDLTLDGAQALRDWIQRGGHLVITLPADGNPWSLGTTSAMALHELQDLLPTRTPRRDEGVKLQTLMPVLSKSDEIPPAIARLNPTFSFRVFEDLDQGNASADNFYEPVIALPDGRVIAISRTFGLGRITVIGLDLSNRTLLSMGFPEGDAFWNRILGRRADTPSGAIMGQLQKAKRLPRGYIRELDVGTGLLVQSQITMSRDAVRGLGLAFFLFVAYWILAGPGGFALLKRYGMAHHSWLAFTVAAGLFTALAWGGVGLLGQRNVSIKHLTILDVLARPEGDRGDNDPQWQRAVSYLSLYLPKYGNMEVNIDSLPGQRDLLANWSPPLINTQPFPNTDRYAVDEGRSPQSYRLPSRATATQLYANWFGSLPAREWGGVFQNDLKHPIEVVVFGDREQALRGIISHNLPGTLRNVTMIWVQNNRPRPRRIERGENTLPVVEYQDRGKMLNIGHIWRMSDLHPGEKLDLGLLQADGSSLMTRNIKQQYAEGYTDQTRNQQPPKRDALEMLSLFQQLSPPEYFLQRSETNVEPSVAIRRVLGREMDLSPWFTRPCLIIIGHLDQSPFPIPFSVDGDTPRVDDGSLTVIRWIYPLPLMNEIAFRSREQNQG